MAHGRGTSTQSPSAQGYPWVCSLTNFLLLSPTRLQDVDDVFLNKAELEAKVGSLKEEAEFLRKTYKEVRQRSIAPASFAFPSWILKLLIPEEKGRGVAQGSGHPLGEQQFSSARSSQSGTKLHRVGDTACGWAGSAAGPASLTSSTPCHHQETHRLQAQISAASVVIKMNKCQDLDLGGITADVRARYEGIARKSRAEAQAWYESKVRKPREGGFGCSSSLQTNFKPRETPSPLQIYSDLTQSVSWDTHLCPLGCSSSRSCELLRAETLTACERQKPRQLS